MVVPAVQSQPKRKLLSERALEYPPKASSIAQSTRSAVKGQTLASISQVCACSCAGCEDIPLLIRYSLSNPREQVPAHYQPARTALEEALGQIEMLPPSALRREYKRGALTRDRKAKLRLFGRERPLGIATNICLSLLLRTTVTLPEVPM